MASAFALSCARRGERTLLMELGVKDKSSSLFGAAQVDSEIREVDENLYAVNVTPQAAMEEYALMVLKIKLIYRAVFENRVVKAFLRVVPGLNELLMLGKAYYHVTEEDERGKPVWDKVIVDAPATGHGIFFLKIASVITNLINSGRMYDEAQSILELLRDETRTGIALVTLAEDMPVNETLMLRKVIEEEMELPVACVIANAIYRPLFSEEEEDWIEAARRHVDRDADESEEDEESKVLGYLEAAKFRIDRVAMQQKYLEKLRAEVEEPLIEIPYYFFDRMSFAIIDEIAGDLDEVVPAETSSAQSAG